MIRGLRHIYDMVKEGRRHNIPWCCGIRHGIDCVRPKPIGMVHPELCARLKTLGPRQGLAFYDGQGCVPCEYHLLKWLVTGKLPRIKRTRWTP